MTQPKTDAQTQHKTTKTDDHQRLTTCLTEALKFEDEATAGEWADCLNAFGVLKEPLTTVELSPPGTWYLYYLHQACGGEPLLVADPDA